MPLPVNSSLILQNPQPGDSLYKKPKHAMIVRMSAETFEALENPQGNRKVEIELGKTPGFHIGGTFFPVVPSEFGNEHELYLRVPSAAKPLAPLKMYGSVIGKLLVERKLDKDIAETVRDRTLEAEKQRTERKAIYLDKPPDLGEPAKKVKKVKKKDPVSARRPAIPTSTFAKPPPPATASSSKASPLPPATGRVSPLPRKASPLPPSKPLPSSSTPWNGSSGEGSNTRSRLIHCLALKPRTLADVITMCAGKECTQPMKKELISLLHAVADASKSSDLDVPQRWHLKPESWREVRPYDWPNLTEEERSRLARQQKAARNSGVPTSDPRNRSNDNSAPGPSNKASVESRPPAQRNGVVMTKNSKKTKTSEGTRKKVSDIMIPAKDESKGKMRDMDESSAAGTPTSATRPPVRRQPGSGYKAKQSATPPISDLRAGSPLPKKLVEARDVKPEPDLPGPSVSSKKPQQPMSPPAHVPSARAASTQIKRKAKNVQPISSRPAEVKREDRERDRGRERDYTEEKPRVKVSASPAPPPLPSFKRKKPAQDDNESESSGREIPLSASTSKRRKVEEAEASPVEKNRGRDLSLPKKPVVREPSPLGPSRPKIKKEGSPLSRAFSPPPAGLPPRPATAGERAHQGSKAAQSPTARAAGGKNRRKSPIYTSSEDESEPSIPRSRPAAPSEEPPAKRPKTAPNPATRTLPRTHTHTPRFKARPMPTDSAGLRKYYHICYGLYKELHADHSQRWSRIQRMLGRVDGKEGGGGRAEDETDEDGDGDDDLSPEVVGVFMDDFKAVTNELNKVRRAYERLGEKADALGELVDVC